NEIWNVLERVVTLDGFFQRVALIQSLYRYAPGWINHFWARQFDPTKKRGTDYDRDRDYPAHEVQEDVNALSDYFENGGGDHAGIIHELSLQLMDAAAVKAQPPGAREPAIP